MGQSVSRIWQETDVWLWKYNVFKNTLKVIIKNGRVHMCHNFSSLYRQDFYIPNSLGTQLDLSGPQTPFAMTKLRRSVKYDRPGDCVCFTMIVQWRIQGGGGGGGG